MPIKKSELYSSLWKSCDELRGGMDASQYKDYVLVILFVKYVSDKYTEQRQPLITIPPGNSFADMIALKGNPHIGERINTIIAKLAEVNHLQGVIDVADFNDPDKLGKGREMVDRLSNLISIFDSPALDFRSNRAEGDDLLGDAYEYLMRHFATESGKSKGQFYTPAEVSRVMAKVIGIGSVTSSTQTIYDPTCGSGSLLLKAHDEALGTTGIDISIYGQEMDNSTAALAKMNMILHGCPSAEIWQDNTLSAPYYRQNGGLKTFDFAVANPPFSMKAWSNGFTPARDEFRRFEPGIPPEKNGDYAFLLHILASLKSSGKGAVIMPHGVLFRGNAEGVIRRNIIRRGVIKGIIGLPPNLFYGTGIPACIIVLDKKDATARKGIFMIDASRGFRKEGNKNRLRAQDIHLIVDTFTRMIEIPGYSRMVTHAEIEANDFNLNLPRYIDSSEAEDLQDIEAHLHGGIPVADVDALRRYWTVFPAVRAALFAPSDRPDYVQLTVPAAEIRQTIFGHSEFAAFNRTVTRLFETWGKKTAPLLNGIGPDTKPKMLIESISESLLEIFRGAPLVDPYDVYQHLMDYWTETMQDDVYMVVVDGWKAGNAITLIESKTEKAEFMVGRQKYRGALIPAQLIVEDCFAGERRALERMEAEQQEFSRRLEELEEEHGGEEGLLEEVRNDSGKITKGSVTERLREIGRSRDAEEERTVLTAWLEATETVATLGREIKEAERALDAAVANAYRSLTEKEVQHLVVEKKWRARLAADVQTEMDRVSQMLTGRIRELAERYATPLQQQTDEVEQLSRRVEAHLERMGFAVGVEA